MKDELVNRLTVALRCAEKYPRAYIVCTGGGTAEKNENATGDFRRAVHETAFALLR